MQPQIFKLSLRPDDHPPRVPVVFANQYDVGRPFQAQILDVDDTPYEFTDETVTVVGTKPTGTGFSYDATGSGSTVSFATTGQMTVAYGFVRCGIIITKGSVVVGTLIFQMYVQRAPLQTGTIVDSDDFDSILEEAARAALSDSGILIQAAKDYLDEAIVISETQPEDPYGVNKIWMKDDGETVQVPTWEEFEPAQKALGLFRHPVYHDGTLTAGLLNTTTGGINTTSTKGAVSKMITIFDPALITNPDPSVYAMAVVEFDNNTTSSTARFIRAIRDYAAAAAVVTDEEYPCFFKLGFQRLDGADLTSADTTALAAYSVLSADAPPMFASVSMFPRFAITGCSWDAGSIYGTSSGHVTQVGLGWAENLARRNGITVGNYAIGAQNLRSWFNYDAGDAGDAHSFKALLEADAYPCYVLIWGNSNDANSGFVENDADYSASTPSTTTYYIGTLEDISTRQNYEDYPCTFYGYYGRVIEMIQAHAPNTRIIISSPDTTTPTNAKRIALRTACEEIAEYYGLPYMDIESDPYYPIFVNELVQLHPTAPTYSGWAMAFERLFARCVQDNKTYFDYWGGTQNTVTVAWAPVTL